MSFRLISNMFFQICLKEKGGQSPEETDRRAEKNIHILEEYAQNENYTRIFEKKSQISFTK